MEFDSARHTPGGVIYNFEPPIDLPYGEMPSLPLHNISEIVAAHLVGKRGREAVAQMAHRIFVIAEVAPNPAVFARQLTELTEGNPVITVR